MMTRGAAGAPPRSGWRVALKVAGVLTLLLTAAGVGAGLSLLQRFQGHDNILTTIRSLGATTQALRDPRSEFPGRDRLIILCLGLDRNIIRSRDPRINGMPSTRNSRSDVMMLASLDLVNQTVSIVSVPRDTRVRLPGRRSYSKINEAHARGGIPYTRQAVEEFLGVPIDYHVVIKQEAIEAVVDALGGLRLNVEKDMDYDDSWGQLHIHLKKGDQVLAGESVVGYMRFRHDAEGDFGRIRRQQQVMQALSQQVKRPDILLKAAGLISAVREHVRTDLSPDQQLALANLFHRVQPGSLVTAQLPVADTRTVGGVSYVVPDEERTRYLIDWILRGNQEAMHPLVRVELRNASGDHTLYQRVYRLLRHAGFQVWRAGRSSEELAQSRVVQRGTMKGAARRVLDVLGLQGVVIPEEGSGPEVTFVVGRDAAHCPGLLFADSLDDLPDAPRSVVRRIDPDDEQLFPRRRRRRSADEPVRVNVEPAPEPEQEEEPPPGEGLSIPGTADPPPPAEPPPTTELPGGA